MRQGELGDAGGEKKSEWWSKEVGKVVERKMECSLVAEDIH